MLAAELAAPEETTPAELAAEYRAAVGAIVDAVGVETVAERTDVAPERLRSVAAGEVADPPLTVAEAAAVLATGSEYPDAETIELEVRDALLLGMSTAVLDVDAVAAEIDGLDATAVHQRIEGRQPTTLAEYAEIRHVIATAGR